VAGDGRSRSAATLISRLLLVVAFVVAVITPLEAGTFNVGVVSFDVATSPDPDKGVPGTNVVNVLNLTGTSNLPPDFPIESDVSLVNPSIVVSYSGGGNVTLADTVPWVFSATEQITQIEFLATFQTTELDGKSFLSNGLWWTPASTSIDTIITPSSGSLLVAGTDLSLITINVPEPEMAVTLIIGILAVIGLFCFSKRSLC
jgi:hypothetical protein